MPVSPRSQRKARSYIAAATAVALTLVLPAVAAADLKPYQMVLSPSSVSVGQQTITATLTNGASNQDLGSANLTAPAAFTVRSASLPASSPGSATVRNGIVELRDLSLRPGAQLPVAITVDVGCAAGAYAWSVLAKQANRFNGPPGNEFVLVSTAAERTTTVVGGCGLRFVTQPQDARVGQRLTGADFDPSGPPISVEVVDGAGQRVTSASPQVSLAFATASGPGPLAGTTTVTAGQGLAEFSDLSVGAPGTYSLRASAGGQEAVSAEFAIEQVAVECIEDVDCAGEISTSESRVQANAFANGRTDAGFLTLSFNTGFRPDCAGYEEYSADWAIVIGPDRQKTVVYSIDKRVMNANPNNGVSFVQMCFAAPFTFATRSGLPPAEFDTDGDGDTDWFVATLPDCGVAPCVAGRRKDKAGNGIIEVKAPAGAEDPAYRP